MNGSAGSYSEQLAQLKSSVDNYNELCKRAGRETRLNLVEGGIDELDINLGCSEQFANNTYFSCICSNRTLCECESILRALTMVICYETGM